MILKSSVAVFFFFFINSKLINMGKKKKRSNITLYLFLKKLTLLSTTILFGKFLKIEGLCISIHLEFKRIINILIPVKYKLIIISTS